MKKGEILVHSIGCGCDSFWQVVEATGKFVVVKRLEEKIINRNVRCQTYDIVPIKNKFCPPKMDSKYLGGYKAGNPKFKEVDKNTLKLKIADDGHIGPIKRMIWWKKWSGKKQNQYCP